MTLHELPLFSLWAFELGYHQQTLCLQVTIIKVKPLATSVIAETCYSSKNYTCMGKRDAAKFI